VRTGCHAARGARCTRASKVPKAWLARALPPGGGRLVTLEVEGDAGFTLGRVEHDVGYAGHGYEERAYRGRLYVTLDSSGRLAAVLAIALEELLRFRAVPHDSDTSCRCTGPRTLPKFLADQT